MAICYVQQCELVIYLSQDFNIMDIIFGKSVWNCLFQKCNTKMWFLHYSRKYRKIYVSLYIKWYIGYLVINTSGFTYVIMFIAYSKPSIPTSLKI